MFDYFVFKIPKQLHPDLDLKIKLKLFIAMELLVYVFCLGFGMKEFSLLAEMDVFLQDKEELMEGSQLILEESLDACSGFLWRHLHS